MWWLPFDALLIRESWNPSASTSVTIAAKRMFLEPLSALISTFRGFILSTPSQRCYRREAEAKRGGGRREPGAACLVLGEARGGGEVVGLGRGGEDEEGVQAVDA